MCKLSRSADTKQGLSRESSSRCPEPEIAPTNHQRSGHEAAQNRDREQYAERRIVGTELIGNRTRAEDLIEGRVVERRPH